MLIQFKNTKRVREVADRKGQGLIDRGFAQAYQTRDMRAAAPASAPAPKPGPKPKAAPKPKPAPKATPASKPKAKADGTPRAAPKKAGK